MLYYCLDSYFSNTRLGQVYCMGLSKLSVANEGGFFQLFEKLSRIIRKCFLEMYKLEKK